MRRCFIALGVVIALVVLAAGVASAKTVPPPQWAPKFCNAISTFQDHLSKDGNKADAVLSGDITSLAGAKSTLVAFMGKAVADADTALAALQRAGAPNAPNGSKLTSRFVSAFRTARGVFASGKTTAQGLPTKTLARFEAATEKLSADLTQGGNTLAATTKGVQSLDTSGKIAAALQAEPKCAFLQNA
jgi:hypothetical protein